MVTLLAQLWGCGIHNRGCLGMVITHLHFNTSYAIELNTTVFIEEWNKDIRIMLEEAGFFGEEGFRYINKRQEQLILIGE